MTWPACERYTYRGAGTGGRSWVCTESEGEELCAWCRADQWRVYNEEIIGNFHLREERARQDAQPYRELFTGKTQPRHVPTLKRNNQVLEAMVHMGRREAAE